MRRILNVAEKPSAAKEITRILSKGASRTVYSKSKYNPIYEFQYDFSGEEVIMSFTSVTGHIMQLDFEEQYGKKYWSKVPPEALFRTAKINKFVDPEKESLAQNLVNVSKVSQGLILWLDCDREGEAIAYEVLEICQNANARLQIFRAQFSAFTKRDIEDAMRTLRQPNPYLAAAVESRQEIDLRIGSAFTRFQTNLLQKKLPNLAAKVISYGPCQFPTLGFVVERYKKVKNFIPEDFWFLYCKHEKTHQRTGTRSTVEFIWDRKHLFDKESVQVFYDKCMEYLEDTVIDVTGNQKSRWRPAPLSTVNLQKIATSKLRLASHRVMEIAEKLYNRGLISYPRTETDSFTKNINVRGLIEYQRQHPVWGNYANELLDNNKFQWPRNGGHDDKAHPPIHPVKMVTQNEGLTFDEWRIYELVTRHFLACCSQDAKGFETVVRIEISLEFFHAKGLIIKEYNWLEVYPYERWSGEILPDYNRGEKFRPTQFLLKESTTSPPKLLAENELITLMDKHGIGTDATIHEHIKTIQERNYATKVNGGLIQPTNLGVALVESYEKMGIDLWKPFLRAAMEQNMTEISRGNLTKEAFIDGCLNEIQELYQEMKSKEGVIIDVMKLYFTDMEPEAGNVDLSGGDIDPSTFGLLNDQEGNCGNCGNRSLRLYGDPNGTKIARCEPDDIILKLPRKGELNFEEKTCPLCSFQVIEVKTENNTRYNICPMCNANPPQTLFEDNAEVLTNMPCFKCPSTECPLAKGMSNKPVFMCPKCKAAGMAFKKNKNSKFFLGCQGYPKCNNIIGVPDCIKEVKILGETCQKCRANKVNIKFSNDEILPPQVRIKLDEGESSFCFTVGCDRDLESLGYSTGLGGGGMNSSNPIPQATQNRTVTAPSNQIRTGGSVQSAIQRFNTTGNNNNIQIGYEAKSNTTIREPSKPTNSNMNLQTNNMNSMNPSNPITSPAKSGFCNKCKKVGHWAGSCPNGQQTTNMGPNSITPTRSNPSEGYNTTPQHLQKSTQFSNQSQSVIPVYTSMTNVANQASAKLAEKSMEKSNEMAGVLCMKCKRTGHLLQNCPGLFGKANVPQTTNSSFLSNAKPFFDPEAKSNPLPKKPNNSFQNGRSYLGNDGNTGFSNYPDENQRSGFEDYLNKEASSMQKKKPQNFGNNSSFGNDTNFGDSERPKLKGSCFKCGEEGHWAPNCPNGDKKGALGNKAPNRPFGASASFNNNESSMNNNDSAPKQKGACFKCNQVGHWANNCPNQNAGEKPQYGNYGGPNQQKPFNKGDNGQTGGFSGNKTIVCYKCNEPGHIAPKCPLNNPNGVENANPNGLGGRKKRDQFEGDGNEGGYGGKRNGEQKTCNLCGAMGRHPKGSSCPKVKRKQTKKNPGEFGEFADYGGGDGGQGDDY